MSDWIEKCYTCVHCYIPISDADEVRCKCRKGCRYEQAKFRRNGENPEGHEGYNSIATSGDNSEKRNSAIDKAIEALNCSEMPNNSDCISRKWLINRLKHRRNMFCKNGIDFFGLSRNDKARVDEMDKCISDVINAPTIEWEQEKGKWIPCSERLPEEHIGFYLVTVQKRRIAALNVVGCDNTVHDIVIARWDYDRRAPQRGYHWCNEDKVIAWMPLPEPYREEGEKDG